MAKQQAAKPKKAETPVEPRVTITHLKSRTTVTIDRDYPAGEFSDELSAAVKDVLKKYQ